MSERMPWRRHFAADFTVETHYLTLAQVGILTRLRDEAWMRLNCAIPADPGWIARRLGITDPDQYRREVEPVLAEFWKKDGLDLVCDALRKERAHAEKISAERRRAAQRRHFGPNVTPLNVKGNG